MQKQSRQSLKFQALLAERAHFLRHNLTENEQVLWRRISGNQLGVAFRRQVTVDRYILDFVAPAVKLAVGRGGQPPRNSRFALAQGCASAASEGIT